MTLLCRRQLQANRDKEMWRDEISVLWINHGENWKEIEGKEERWRKKERRRGRKSGSRFNSRYIHSYKKKKYSKRNGLVKGRKVEIFLSGVKKWTMWGKRRIGKECDTYFFLPSFLLLSSIFLICFSFCSSTYSSLLQMNLFSRWIELSFLKKNPFREKKEKGKERMERREEEKEEKVERKMWKRSSSSFSWHFFRLLSFVRLKIFFLSLSGYKKREWVARTWLQKNTI